MPYLGEIAGLATSFLWTFTALFFTVASKQFGSFSANILRLPLALLLLFISYSIFYGDYDATTFQIWMLILSGIIGLIMGDTFLFESFNHIGPRLSLLVFSLYPAMAAIIAHVTLHESISLLGYVGIIMTISGIMFVVSEKKMDKKGQIQRVSLIGVGFALLGGLGQATGLVMAKSALRTGINPMLATVIRITAATLFIWPAAALIGKLQNPVRLLQRNKRAIPFLLGGTFFGPFLGIWMSQVAIKYTDTGVAATFMSLMPILIIPLEVVVYGRKPSLRAIVGTIFAVAGVAILFLR